MFFQSDSEYLAAVSRVGVLEMLFQSGREYLAAAVSRLVRGVIVLCLFALRT